MAVDGNTSTKDDGATCAHTTQGNVSHPAWWQVDLGTTYRITGIKIINRQKSGMQCNLKCVPKHKSKDVTYTYAYLRPVKT